MPPKSRLLFGEELSRGVQALKGVLGAADAKRLNILVELATAQTTSLSQVVTALFPGKPGDKALADVTAFRKRLNDAASGKVDAATTTQVRWQVDTKKQSPLSERTCWFSGPDQAAVNAAEFSRVSVQDAGGEAYVKAKVIPSSANALQKGKSVVRFFLSYSHGRTETALKDKLLAEIKKHFNASAKYELNIWQDEQIVVGEGWHSAIQGAIDSCDFGLLLVCPAFLGSTYIKDHELPYFVGTEQKPPPIPVIPVGLNKVLFDGSHDLKGLESHQFFLLKSEHHESRRFYSELTSDQQRERFCEELFKKILLALDRHFGKSEALSIAEADPASRGHSNQSPAIDDEGFAREMLNHARHGRDAENIKHFQPTRVAVGPGSEGTDAIKYLFDWLKAPKAPPVLYLLGEFGSGKTTTLKELTRRLLEERESNPKLPLPLFIDLRHYLFDSNRRVPETIHELLNAVIRRNWKLPGLPTITADDLLRLVREENALLIVDGLDEKTVHLEPAEARAFLRVIWQAIPDWPAAKIYRKGSTAEAQLKEAKEPSPGQATGRLIISCRSHYFRDIETQSSMLTGEDREQISRRSENTPVLTLLPFTKEQIDSYLNGVLDGDAGRVQTAIELIESVHNLKDLAERPYLLSLIVEQLDQLEVFRKRGEVVNAARLYQLFTQRWLSRDEGKHTIDPMHKRVLMEELAAHLWRIGEKELSPDDLDRWLDRFLVDHRDIAGAYENVSRKVIKEDFRTACFVLREDRGGDESEQGSVRSAFRFAHTSMQEFFLAAYLWHGLKDGQTAGFDLPMVSDETLDFLGQLLQLEQPRARDQALGAMNGLFDGELPGATRLMFRYWLRAIEHDLPEPAPSQVDLSGLDLDEWNLRGHSVDRPLRLTGAKLVGTQLNRARLRWVDLRGGDCSGLAARQGVWQQVRADRTNWAGADLAGLQWRGGSLAGANFVPAVEQYQLLQIDGGPGGASLRANHGVAAARGAKPLAPMLQMSTGHAGSVSACGWSPDGGQLVSGSGDNTLKIWDPNTGECCLTLEGHAHWVRTCGWSPDGGQLVSGSSDSTLKIWDPNTGECCLTLEGHAHWVSACSWSPDGGQLVSASSDSTLKIWDARTGQCRLTLEGHAGSVSACGWSPDGGQLVSASADKTLKIWDAQTGQCRLTLEGHANLVLACGWSPDGSQLVSASADKTLKIWDAQTGQCRLTLEGHAEGVNACGWSPDGGQLVSGSDDKSLKIWDAQTGTCRLTLAGHTDTVNACGWSPDGGQVVSASSDNTLKIWDPQTGQCRFTLDGQENRVSACDWSPDGSQLVSGSRDKTLKIWDARTGQCRLTLQGHANWVSACSWSPDGGQLVSGSSDNTLKIWDPHTGECCLTLEGHTNNVFACDWSFDGGQVVSGSWDNLLKIWDAQTGQCRHTLKGHSLAVLACGWSPDGRQLVSGSGDKTLKIWDARTGQCRLTLAGHTDTVFACGWSPDGGQVVSGSWDNTLKIWDAQTGQCRLTLEGHAGWVLACGWSPDGSQLASGSRDNTLKIWDAQTGTCRLTLEGHANTVLMCGWSPDGGQLVSGSWDNTLKIWDAQTGTCHLTVQQLPEGHWAGVRIAQNGRPTLVVSPEAWRWLMWRIEKPGTGPAEMGPLDLVPLEAFGPVEGLE